VVRTDFGGGLFLSSSFMFLIVRLSFCISLILSVGLFHHMSACGPYCRSSLYAFVCPCVADTVALSIFRVSLPALGLCFVFVFAQLCLVFTIVQVFVLSVLLCLSRILPCFCFCLCLVLCRSRTYTYSTRFHL
jgi:hypothetical protein